MPAAGTCLVTCCGDRSVAGFFVLVLFVSVCLACGNYVTLGEGDDEGLCLCEMEWIDLVLSFVFVFVFLYVRVFSWPHPTNMNMKPAVISLPFRISSAAPH